MHQINYNYIRTKYNNHAKLLSTDRDSSVYEIETIDIYEEFSEEKDLFDFSDFPKVFLILVVKKNDKFEEKIIS